MAGGLVGGGLEIGVSEPAIAAREQHDALADFGEIGNQRFVVVFEHLRADGDAQDGILAIGAGAVLAHAVSAGGGLEVLLVAIIDKRVEAIDAFDDDIAAASAIAAVRPAELDELFTQEGDDATAAIARANKDLGLI